jgi:tetratricopeptide (TPR) repeat protein
MGLDWDAPPYPALPAISVGAAPGGLSQRRAVRVVGEILEPQARREAERAVLDRRLDANPDDAEARIHRGWLYLVKGKLPEAIADLDHLHRRQPDYSEVERMLGQAYQGGSDAAGALDFYGRLLERAPGNHDTRFQRGLTALALGRVQQALDDFDRILAALPASDAVRFRRARALNRLGRYHSTLADADVLHARHADDFNISHLRGTAYDGLGKREPARLAWEKAHFYLPKEPYNLNYHARAMVAGSLSARDADKALVLARYAVALAPDPSPYLNTLGASLYGVGRYREAIDVLERSIGVGRGENDGFGLYFLAMAHRGLGHRAQARRDFDRAVRWSAARKDLSPQQLQELAAFRAEAEAVLAGPGGDLPADLFAPP